PGGARFMMEHARVGASTAVDRPILRFHGARDGSPILRTHPRAMDVVIEDLVFDTIYSQDTDKRRIAQAIKAEGGNLTVRRCVFLNVEDGLNSNARPVGLLMQQCIAPLTTGLRGYLAWVEGTDHVYLGNTVVNSTREAPLRISFTGAERVLIAGNHFSNLDRTSVDRLDTSKNALTVHSGRHVYITGNILEAGPVAIGPLGERDGFRQPNQQLQWVVFEDNLVRASTLRITHGLAGAMIRNNRFWATDRAAINVEGYSRQYQRGSRDIAIVHNTAYNQGTRGTFLRVGGKVERIRLENNLFIAPGLSPGSHSTAVVYVGGSDLGSFQRIDGNLWPECRPQPFARGGVFYVWPSWSDARGYLPLPVWNERAGADDRQATVRLDSSLRPVELNPAVKRKPAYGVTHDAGGGWRDPAFTSPGAWD
ncbi:MAG: right-handed parallel beta-helix repeat-containing protein, partial [Phycisphaerae bacterium]|nr:right-handed parallel beta-helix repeat-containing protein [Phycisphaerae bacterium]